MKYLFLVFFSIQAIAQDLSKEINVSGERREYIVHLPANYVADKMNPVVLVFHGGGGSAKTSLAFFGMNAVADTAGFIAVYPNGLKKGWNDGRTIKNHTHDDIGFVNGLIEQLKKDYSIDEKRIFATGISNGGFFSFALAAKLFNKIRAIAPVCATIPEVLIQNYTPGKPISLLLINGTEDPLVPYNGGKIGGRLLNRGQCSSTIETVKKFITMNQCDVKPTTFVFPDNDPNDGCTAKKFSYSCTNENRVQLIRIEGGGHTWPGGKQYLGKRLVGKVCRDFSAAAEIWNFFRSLSSN